MAGEFEIRAELVPKDGLRDSIISFGKGFSKHLRPSLESAAYELAENMKTVFDLKGKRGDNDPWIVTENPDPLVDKGDLRDSIDGEVVDQGNDLVIYIGTDKPYARVLQEGGEVDTDVVFDPDRTENGSLWKHTGHSRPKEIPERPFLFLTDEDSVLLQDAIHTSIDVAGSFEGFEIE